MPNPYPYDNMTDFTLEDGTVLDVGQRWILMYNKPIKVTICQLMPTREMIRVQTTGQRGSERVTDINWTSWIELYEKGMAFPKKPNIEPEKVVPKFKFK